MARHGGSYEKDKNGKPVLRHGTNQTAVTTAKPPKKPKDNTCEVTTNENT